MKVGMGFRANNRVDKYAIQYSAQIGAPHGIVSMPDEQVFPNYKTEPWSYEELSAFKKFYADNGVNLVGFENFHPSVYYKAMLDVPGKEQQVDYVKRCIENMGKAGIKVMGYNFTFAGVTARVSGPFARGGAETVRFTLADAPIDGYIPLGTIGKRIVDPVDPDAPEGVLDPVSLEEITERRDWFLGQILPVAEEAGVKMCAHPEDPPIPVMQNTARILINQQAYDDLFKKFDSLYNCIEFCQGTFAEMGADIEQTIRHFAKNDKIGYVHFRNVKGTAANQYSEVFIDEGDIDMVKALKTYKEVGYTGLLMPDHTPLVNLPGANEIGMGFAIGYIRGIMHALDIDIEDFN